MAKRVFRLASLFVLFICVSSTLYAQQDEASLLEQASAAFSQQDNEINAQANSFVKESIASAAENVPAIPGPVSAQNTAAPPAENPVPPVSMNTQVSAQNATQPPADNAVPSSSMNTQVSAQNATKPAADNPVPPVSMNTQVSAQNATQPPADNAVPSSSVNTQVLAQNTTQPAADNPVSPSSINMQMLAQNTAAALQVNPPAVAVPVPVPVSVPATNSVTTTTQTKSVTVSKMMSSGQFQKWLENNGYLENKADAKPTTTVNRVVRRVRRPLAPRILTLQQSQQAMLRTAPSPIVPPPPDSGAAFNLMLQQNMPLTPRQVVRLHQQIDVAQRAAAISPTIPPKPVSTTLMVNLAPGTTPPAIRLAQGYVSSLVFVDSTGAPWPIASFDIGNPKAVNMQWDGKSNILLIQAVSPYSNGDIVVRLAGLPTPVTLELVSGQRVVDYRADIHIPRIGPNTKDLPIGTILPSSANQLLLDILSGIAPDGSRQLLVGGGECEAWLLGDTMYIRTRLTLLSPGWVGKMVSPDGMKAYELAKTSSILVSRFGEPVELKIEGF